MFSKNVQWLNRPHPMPSSLAASLVVIVQTLMKVLFRSLKLAVFCLELDSR